jgi:3-phosphoshikimate 1-carboxyvinyltransferase
MIETDPTARTIRISGQQNLFAQATTPINLHIGLAGTAARFLTALCAAAPRGTYRIDGVPQMRKRPMRGLLDALRSLGADIRCLAEEHHFPIEIHARSLRGGPVTIDATESSQMLSALLMVSPLAAAPLDIRLTAPVRQPFVQMTQNLMAHFGWSSTGPRSTGFQPVCLDVARASSPCDATQSRPLEFGICDLEFPATSGHPYRSPGTYPIEPDATAASYYLALPLVTGGALTLNSLRAPAADSLQGDTHFAAILQPHGLHLQETPAGLIATAPTPARQRAVAQTAKSADEAKPRPIQNPKSKIENFSSFSDTFLTLAAIAPLLPAPTRITGIAHTRKQETDRVSGMARELTRLGQRVIETEDSLEIHPRPLKPDQLIQTYHDHRFAMSFAILGSHDLHRNGRPWLTIDNPACCTKTFPNFFTLLETIRTTAQSA